MNKKGFTLVEILAVVALIAIVSVGAIIAVNTMITRQRIKTATASENNIGEAALAIQSQKHNLYLPACVDKNSGNYINIPQTTLKKINDDLRSQMASESKVTDAQKQQFIKDYVNTINNNDAMKQYFSDTYLNVKDLNCFKVTSVSDLIKEGYLKDLDNGCDRATLVLIYNKGDSAATAGTLKSVQETGVCKGSESEEKGPLITVSPEKDLSSSATKTVTVTATANESKLKSNLTLVYGWSKSVRSKPSTWETKTLSGDQNKVTATLSKTGMDDEYYLWIKAGSVKDNKGYSNITFATGPYAFLPTPIVTYYTKNTDNSFSDPIRGRNRCNGETNCSGKTKKVVFRKLYGQNVEGNTSSLCTPNCTGYKFERWKYEELTITNSSIVVNRNDHILTAIYSPRRYKITFDANTGKACTIPQKTITFDEPYGTLCLTSKIGYTEIGDWWDAKNGGHEIHSSTRMTTAANHSIYKHWDANPFYIAYAGNGATSGATARHRCIYDSVCNLSNNGFVRTGYTFNGWKKENAGSALAAGASVKNATATRDATVTYYAQWCQNCITPSHGSCTLNVSTPGTCKYTTPCNTGYHITTGNETYRPSCAANTYTIAFNGNGNTGGSTASKSCTYDQNCVLTNNGFSKTGYTFIGWATSAGGAVAYANGATVKNLTTINGATVTLYAKWKPITYTIAFNGNGNTGGSTASKSCTYDQNCKLTNNGFSKTGYTFSGWAKSAGGAVAYGNGANVKNLTTTNGATVTLYAKWKPITYKIVFNGNGNTGGSTASKSCTYDQNCKLTNNGFSKTAYTYTGWAKSAGGAVAYGNGANVKNLTTTNGATVTLYAKWNINRYTITIGRDANHISSVSLDGSTTVLSKTVNHGTRVTISAASLDYHQFTGWSDGNTQKTNRVITITGNTSLTAYGRENTATVYYYKNGGTIQKDNGLGIAVNTPDPIYIVTRNASFNEGRNLYNYTADKSNLHLKKKNCTSKKKYAVYKFGTSTKLVTVDQDDSWNGRKDQWQTFGLLDELKVGDSAVAVYPQWKC